MNRMFGKDTCLLQPFFHVTNIGESDRQTDQLNPIHWVESQWRSSVAAEIGTEVHCSRGPLP